MFKLFCLISFDKGTTTTSYFVGQIFKWFSILCDQDQKKKNTILFKIMEKYSVPNIPTTQGVLEDIFDEEIVPVKDHPIKLAEGNESLLNAHCCYKNFKQLQEDVMKQDGLNSKLDELNQKLVENIANMKQQT